jgi:hypothetical protein
MNSQTQNERVILSGPAALGHADALTIISCTRSWLTVNKPREQVRQTIADSHRRP